MNKQRAKVGFVFSTKDRVEFTLRSLRSIDTEGGFDLIWVDGSDTPEGKALPEKVKLSNCRLAEVHYDIKGGPDNAIRFGLQRLLDLGYDYCGLIENDIEFKPGWFSKLMELFKLGKSDGLSVGAVTVRAFKEWVLSYKPNYAILWTVGAGMVLFRRKAAEIVLNTYGAESIQNLRTYYLKEFGIDIAKPCLRNLKTSLSRMLLIYTRLKNPTCDYAYSMHLYKYGLASIGSITPMAYNMDMYSVILHHKPTWYVSHPVQAALSFYKRLRIVIRG